MKRNVKLFAVVSLSVLAGLVLKSDRGHGQVQGSQSPIIIKQIFLENQTATPPKITLFTPTASGLYRVSVYVSIFSGANSSICPEVDWFDALNLQSALVFPTLCVNPGGSGNGAIVVHSLTNEPVDLIPGFSAFSGEYNLFVTVEQL